MFNKEDYTDICSSLHITNRKKKAKNMDGETGYLLVHEQTWDGSLLT